MPSINFGAGSQLEPIMSIVPTITEAVGDIGATTSSVDGGIEPSSWVERDEQEVERLHALRSELLSKVGLKGRAVTLEINTPTFGAAKDAGVSGGATGIVNWDGPCDWKTNWDGSPNPRVGERKITLKFDAFLTSKVHKVTGEPLPALFSFYYADMKKDGHILGGFDEGTEPTVRFADYLHGLEQKLEAWYDRKDAS